MQRGTKNFIVAKSGHRLQRNADHSLAPLLVRAGAVRSLGSIMVLLSLVLLGLGIYQVMEAVRHPLEAESAMVIAAAVFIALAIILFFYVLEPLSAPRLIRRRQAASHVHRYALGKELHMATQSTGEQSELPFGPPLAERRGTGD
jgi:hypothetical protein